MIDFYIPSPSNWYSVLLAILDVGDIMAELSTVFSVMILELKQNLAWFTFGAIGDTTYLQGE